MFRSAAATVALVTMITLSACQPTPPPPPACPAVTWGSSAKVAGHLAANPIVGLRAGRHDCFDRLVVDLASTPLPGWSVRYGTVREPGTGDVVALRGGAALEIVADAPAYGPDGHATYGPPSSMEAVSVTGYETFRQVAYAGSFEGTTTFGLGVRARLPFRVTTATSAGRTMLVIDVAHSWSAT